MARIEAAPENPRSVLVCVLISALNVGMAYAQACNTLSTGSGTGTRVGVERCIFKPGDHSQAWTPAANCAEARPAASSPIRIFFDGQDVTDKTASVVTGQRILLTACKANRVAAFPLNKWELPPSFPTDGKPPRVIGKLDRYDNFKQTPVSLNQSSLEFYWLDAGDGRVVRHSLGSGVDAEVSFNVEGPGHVFVFSKYDLVHCSVDAKDQDVRSAASQFVLLPTSRRFKANEELHPEAHPVTLSFGFGTSRSPECAGIQFLRSDSHASVSGTFRWLQVIGQAWGTIQTSTGQNSSCNDLYRTPSSDATYKGGLDGGGYYGLNKGSTPDTNDSPAVELDPNWTDVNYSFAAAMFLLWEPSDLARSIPVSLGFLAWTISAEVRASEAPASLPKLWSFIKTSQSAAPFLPSVVYPTWEVNLVDDSAVVDERNQSPGLEFSGVTLRDHCELIQRALLQILVWRNGARGVALPKPIKRSGD